MLAAVDRRFVPYSPFPEIMQITLNSILGLVKVTLSLVGVTVLDTNVTAPAVSVTLVSMNDTPQKD